MTSVVAYNAGTNSVDVTSTGGFSIGDTVLLIQMKGATINTTNSSAYGDISSIGSAGLYEFAQICDITGNTVTFDFQMLNTYDPAGAVQMVRVPVFTDVNVVGTLTENAWDPSTGTGGVLVMAAQGTVTLGANIDMNGRGFKGGWDIEINSTCGCSPGDPQYTDYFYPDATFHGAAKGEGISDYISGQEAGRGKLANGGGGGNEHNAGGGGGANYGVGGLGGTTVNPSCFFGAYCRGLNPGVGGLALGPTHYSAAAGRVFMGGGGGSGHDNNTTGTPGANGGGIVIIWAGAFNGGGRQILARGNGVTLQAQGDGCGGGGAGGAIMMNVGAYLPGTITFDVSGGKGGDNNWAAANTNCKGPGGGGGGGVIWTSGPSLPGGLTTVLNGGVSGRQVGATCNGQTMGATAGANGAVLTGLLPRISTTDYAACNLLPVTYSHFHATIQGSEAHLDWATLSETNSARFEVQRSADAQEFHTIGEVQAAGFSGSLRDYQFTDPQPLYGESWYRLVQIDIDGSESKSEIRKVSYTPGSSQIVVYPNPVNSSQMRIMMAMEQAGQAHLSVTDALGRQMLDRMLDVPAGYSTESVNVNGWSSGVYFVKLRTSDQQIVQKVIVE